MSSTSWPLGPRPVPVGYYHNCKHPCGVPGCLGWPAQLRQDARAVASWCACNDHDTPTPCRCEPVKKAIDR